MELHADIAPAVPTVAAIPAGVAVVAARSAP
jgi:hypothetical protein